MPYFIRRMIRKRISYVEDSFLAPSQENMILIKPFLITRKRVSRAIRNTLRNRAKNLISDYISERTNNEIFNDILSNAYIQVSKSSEIAHNTWCEDWVKSDENTGGDSDRDFYQYQLTLHKYKPRISDLYNGVIDYLITKHKFSELNFSARFIPSDNHGLVPDEIESLKKVKKRKEDKA